MNIDRMASRIAVALNGGAWDAHYTEAQKDVWRNRVRVMLGVK